MFLALLALCAPLWAQSPCGRGTPGQLATVAVWVRHNGSQSQFRISDEDLTDEEFQRSPADRDLFPIQLSRQPGSCPVGICALRLSASRRLRDGALIQQEDVFGVPEGLESLHDDFYCGRAKGDCGADVPVYRFVRGRGSEATVAYSLDSAASLPGFGRDPRPLCYAWSELGSARKPVSGDQCLKIQDPSNSQIEYSAKDSASLPVGTTAFLRCSSGFVTAGPSSLLCTRSGWNPPLPGECVRQPTVPVLSAGSTPFGGMCTPGATVRNGQIIYSQLELNGRLPSGTVASVYCFLGFILSITSTVKCQNGEWVGEWPRCISMDSVRCQPLTVPDSAKISYSPSDSPFSIGSTATLSCTGGQAIAGAVRTTCGNEGWLPKTLGVCVTSHRVKRQGLPCGGILVLNGNATYIQASTTTLYAAGTSVLISCNPGYTIQGSGSALCQNGQWSPTPGTCSISSVNSGSSGAQCLELAAPISGTVAYSQLATGLTRPSGTVATLTCNLGTTVSGALTSTCSNGAWSPATLGTCTSGAGSSVLECTNPIVPLNGQIAYSQSNSIEPVKPVGTVATLTCSLGFTASGAVSSTCLTSTWTPVLGTCSSSPTSTTGQCFGGLVPPIGAAINYSNGSPFGPYPSGTTATLTCTTGTISGAASATCTNGQWTPTTLGTCSSSPTTGGTCSAPVVTGGTLTYSQIAALGGSYPSGTVATLTCTTGAVTGPATATCFNGQWTPVIGSCGGTTGATCPGFFPPLGTSANYSSGGIFGPYNQGTIATLFCTTPGNVVSGASSATCTNGQWTPSLTSSTCTSTGTSTSCPSTVTPPAGGTVTYSNGAIFGPFPSNTIATLTCTTGVVQGLSTSTCTEGRWSALGTCSGSTGGTQCTTAPVVPTGATLTYSNGALFAPYTSGTVATMTCTGSTVIGSSTSTCTNGIWSPLGTCSSSGGQQCLAGVTPPVGGSVSYSNFQVFPPFNGGTVATLTCTPGTVIGLSTSTCTNGVWAPLGTCSTTGGGGTPCISAVVPPIGATVTYSNGQIFAPFTGGTVATLTCPAGTVQGSSTSTCSNGQWSILGTCSTTSTGGQCPSAIVAPVGGTVTYSGGLIFAPFPSNTVATLTCPGSVVQGMSTATCTNGVWSILGTCSGTGTGGQCFSGITYPLGGTVTYSNLQLFAPFQSGTTAMLQCTNGVVIGASSATCNNGVWGMLGTCSTSTGGTSCSSSLTTPVGGSLIYSNGAIFPPFISGTTATLQCTTGTVQGPTTATCSNGQWTTIGTCSPGTGGQQCFTAIATPPGGTVSFTNNLIFPPFSSGTIATLRCNVGTPIGGMTTSTCSFGSWQPPSLANCSTTQSTG